MEVECFNEKMRRRTKLFAIDIYKRHSSIRLNELNRIIVKQLIRSSSSLAANFRAAARGRSQAEFFSKICIVVEECDECLFWIEYLSEAQILDKSILFEHHKEAQELLSIFSTIKRKIKEKKESVK